MKTTHKLLAALTLGAFGWAAAPGYATSIVNDTFDVGASPTIGNDLDDPNDIAWIGGFNNTAVTIKSTAPAPGTGNYIENDVSSGFSMIRGSLPVDTNLTLQVGETLTLTFDFMYSTGNQSADNGLRFGLFNNAGYGTLGLAGVGSTNTALRIRHDTAASIDQNMGSGGGGADEFVGPSDIQTDGTMSSSLDNSSPYDAYAVSLSITRLNATTVTISTTLNGGTATVTDVDDAGDPADNLTDFSGGYIVIRNGGVTNDFRVDNVNLTVIPEPASLALLGLGGLCMLGGRRSRRA